MKNPERKPDDAPERRATNAPECEVCHLPVGYYGSASWRGDTLTKARCVEHEPWQFVRPRVRESKQDEFTLLVFDDGGDMKSRRIGRLTIQIRPDRHPEASSMEIEAYLQRIAERIVRDAGEVIEHGE